MSVFFLLILSIGFGTLVNGFSISIYILCPCYNDYEPSSNKLPEFNGKLIDYRFLRALEMLFRALYDIFGVGLESKLLKWAFDSSRRLMSDGLVFLTIPT